MRRCREFTATEAARALMVSVPTATGLIRALHGDGIAQPAGYGDSSGGRRPRRYRFVPEGAHGIGIAVHPERIEAVCADLDLRVVDECEIPFHRADRNALFAAVGQASEWLSSACAREGRRLSGTGVSLPGIVDEQRGRLTEAPNLLLNDLLLAAFADAVSDAPLPVRCENEANAAALAESWTAAVTREESLTFVSVSEGVGVGVLLDGRLYRGFRFRAGEFGHVPLPGARRRCNCGSIGCWERYASQTALLRVWNPRRADLEGLIGAVTAGQPRALRVVRLYAAHVAMGLRNVIRCLDTPTIVIGGPVAALGSPLVEAIRAALGNTPLESPPPAITLSRLGPHAAALGAAVLPLGQRFPVW